MSKYYNNNDTILGERIYCTFEKIQGKGIISSDKAKDKGQYQTLKGNPATATIVKKLRRIK